MQQQQIEATALRVFEAEYIMAKNSGCDTVLAMESARCALIEALGVLKGLKTQENKEVKKRWLVPKNGTTAQAIELCDLYKATFPRFSQPEMPLNPVFLKRLTEAASVGMEVWKKRFELVRKSDFLMGKAGKFQASLHWLIQPGNIVKLESGGYP